MTTQIVPLPAVTLGRAAGEFLARRDLDADTLRSYGQMLRRLRRALGDTVPLAQLTADQTAAVLTAAWGEAAPRTWNRHRSALRSFTSWAAGPGRGWVTTDLAALIERRPDTRDRTRAIDRHIVTALLNRRDVALRDKTLRRLLYESAARADEVLALNIEDLGLDNKCGRITGKGGTVRWIHWQSGTARLLPRLVGARTSGPLFLADRRLAPTRMPAAADVCPHTGRGRLSYERRVPVQAGHQAARPAPTRLHPPPAPPLPAHPPGRRRHATGGVLVRLQGQAPAVEHLVKVVGECWGALPRLRLSVELRFGRRARWAAGSGLDLSEHVSAVAVGAGEENLLRTVSARPGQRLAAGLPPWRLESWIQRILARKQSVAPRTRYGVSLLGDTKPRAHGAEKQIMARTASGALTLMRRLLTLALTTTTATAALATLTAPAHAQDLGDIIDNLTQSASATTGLNTSPVTNLINDLPIVGGS
ncbi:tyrosine-type recombinase/integrase [Spirillospora sp. NPDC048911]|uniref:tyrosine-type recombinase/integrase n=1 Tax=Spirillospora sp. NPDC048911 TaxID=3364527 RepID=UPI003722DBA2